MSDYGGKTREQEAEDSMRMLAIVLVYCAVMIGLLVGFLVWTL